MKKAYIILYLIACVLIGGVADGLNDSGTQTWGHLLEALEMLCLFGIGFLFRKSWWLLLLSYAFIRVGLFDYAYNIAAGHELLHFGNSNWWDMFLSKQLTSGVVFGRVIFLTAGIAIPIKEL